MNKIKNFKFWCHKVLPLVYDDSLSYYEFLCKVMKKLNEIIDTVNELIEGGGLDPEVIAELQEEIAQINQNIEALQDKDTDLETAIGNLATEIGNINTTLASKVGRSQLLFNVENPSGAALLENIQYFGRTFIPPSGGSGGGNAYEKTVGQFSIAKNSANKIVLSLTFDDLPSGAVIDRIECAIAMTGTVTFRAFPLYPNNGGTAFFACSQGGDNGNSQFTFASGSSAGVTIATLTQESNTLWSTNITENDTPLWARIYYHA